MAFFFGQQFPSQCPRERRQAPPCGRPSQQSPAVHEEWAGMYDPFDFFAEMLGGLEFGAQQAQGQPQCHGPRAAAAATPGCCQRSACGNPKKWQSMVKLPSDFRPSDVEVKAEGRVLIIRATREEGDERTGKDRHEAVRRVEVPENVDMDSVKTLWLRGGQGLMVVGMRKIPQQAERPGAQREEQAASEDKNESEAKKENKKETRAGPSMHPMFPFNVDPEVFREQMKSLMEDLQCPVRGEAASDAAAEKEGTKEGDTSENTDYPFLPFGLDPAHFGEQLKTIIEGVHAAFTDQGARNAKPQTEEPKKTPKSADSEENMDKEEVETSESEWVKPEIDDVMKSEEEDVMTVEAEATTASKVEPQAGDQEGDKVHDLTKYVVETDQTPKDQDPATPESEDPSVHQIQVDISGYTPSEVTVDTSGSRVRVCASHTEGSGDSLEEYSFRRTFTLPENADVGEVSWEVYPDTSLLTISAPVLREHIVKE